MIAYREKPKPASVAPSAPWWRLARAWAGGSLRRLPWAKASRAALTSYRLAWPAAKAPRWIPRGYPLARSAIMPGSVARAFRELNVNPPDESAWPWHSRDP
jgi:hypothetical protein